MRLILFISITLFANIALQASNPIKLDTIVVNRVDNDLLTYAHELKSKDQIDYLVILFKVNKDQLLKINHENSAEGLASKAELLIPIDNQKLITSKSLLQKNETYLPIVYQVKAKDNLFRISRRYFFQSLDELMSRNQLSNYNLSIGQHIHVGWIKVSESESKPRFESIVVESEVKDSVNSTEEVTALEEEAIAVDSSANINFETLDYTSAQGKGMWSKRMHDNGKLFVLHRHAKLNSILEIKNPMLNRTVHAKVAGRIPDNLYPDDIEIFISPSTAKAIGILDSNFFVEIRYIK